MEVSKYIIKFYVDDCIYTFEETALNRLTAIERCIRNIKRTVDMTNILSYAYKIECFLAS